MSKLVRNVLIEQKHLNWIEEESLNFSKWVRKKIDEEMMK